MIVHMIGNAHIDPMWLVSLGCAELRKRAPVRGFRGILLT